LIVHREKLMSVCRAWRWPRSMWRQLIRLFVNFASEASLRSNQEAGKRKAEGSKQKAEGRHIFHFSFQIIRSAFACYGENARLNLRDARPNDKWKMENGLTSIHDSLAFNK
jgi:hypothetical protein